MTRAVFLRAPVFAALIGVTGTVRAQTPRECADHFVSGQSRRAERDYTGAKQDFVACSQLACPQILVKECLAFLSEVERDLPTLGFRVHDDRGAELFDVEVSLDGHVLASKLEGGIFEVNPGIHALRVTASGFEPHAASVSVLPGERGRVLEVTLKRELPPPAPPPAPAPVPIAPPPPRPESAPGFRVPAVSVVAGAVGLVALGTFATFRLSGDRDYDELAASCSPRCTDDEIDPVRRKYVVSSVSLAVAGVALAVGGVTLWLGQPSRAERASRVRVELRATGIRLQTRF